jgi:hypothetical protein
VRANRRAASLKPARLQPILELMTRRVLIALACALVALAAPAAAQAQKPADVTRVEAAITELARLKQGAKGAVAAHQRAAAAALAPCRSRGRGWARIRQVHDPSQRNAYARGAKRLWAGLSEVAAEGAWVEVYTPYFERFLRRFETPLADSALQAGIAAQRSRLAFDQSAYSFGSCATFNRQLKKVREFKIGGSHGVSGDYYAGKIYNDFVRYVSARQRAAARAHWGSRYENALAAARDRLKALGGDEGYANYFPFAFRG